MNMDVPIQHPIIHRSPTFQSNIPTFLGLIISKSQMNPKIAKELRKLLKTISKVDYEQGGLNADDLLATCEKIDPSKHLGTGGSLFECLLLFSELRMTQVVLLQIVNHAKDRNTSLKLMN